MKSVIKWIFLVILIGIFAIDVAGFWKYKLKKDNNTVASQDVTNNENISDKGDSSQENNNEKIEYKELVKNDFSNNQKMFITDIQSEENGEYTIKGVVCEEYNISKDEYTKLNKENLSLNILGIDYSKDKIISGNLKLKSEDENAEKLYIKYDNKNKKYIVKNSENDKTVYKTTENYVQTTVQANFPFDVTSNGKSNKKTVKDMASLYSNISVPTDSTDLDLYTISFNKKGECTKFSK